MELRTELQDIFCDLTLNPRSKLARHHNENKDLSADFTWNDLFLFTFKDDNSTALKQYQAIVDDESKAIDIGSLPQFRPPVRNGSWWLLSLNEPQDIKSQLELLDNFVSYEQSNNLDRKDMGGAFHFQWEVNPSPYQYLSEIREWIGKISAKHRPKWIQPSNCGEKPLQTMQNTTSCEYYSLHPSKLSCEIADQVFERIRSMHPNTDTFAFLHIRRGDTTAECNTSLVNIHEYLRCSFGRISDVEAIFGSVTVLFASDELDHCYRTAIHSIITDGLGFRFVDLDEIVLSAVQRHSSTNQPGMRLLNNYFIFHVTSIVSIDPRIRIFLQQRRIGCPSCNEVVTPEHFRIYSSQNTTVTNLRSANWSIWSTIFNNKLCSQML